MIPAPTPLSAWRDWGVDASLMLALVLLAGAVGVLASVKPFWAAAVVLGGAIVLLIGANVTVLPLFLVLTMFIESVSLGPGFRVGRLAAVLAIAVVAYHALGRRRLDLKPTPLVLAVGGYGFWILLSVYWASDSGLVYRTTFQFLLAAAYLLAFAVLVRTREQVVATFVTLALGSLVFGLTAFVAYVTSSGSFFESNLGATGLQGDHVYFAVYQVLALPAALALAALERSSVRRGFYYGVVGVIAVSIVASLSRTGLVMLAAVIAATLLLPFRIFFRSAAQKLGYAFTLGGAAVVAAIAGLTPFINRAQTIFNFSSSSGDRGSGRIDLWRAALHGFRDHPWFGLGAGNFQAKALDLLQTTPGVNTAASYVAPGRVVHNAYLEALTELGAVGLALFLLILFFTVRSYLGTFRRARAAGDRAIESFSIALIVAVFGFAISMLFASNELGKPLWIFIGLALALERIPAVGVEPRPKPVPRTASAAPELAGPIPSTLE